VRRAADALKQAVVCQQVVKVQSVRVALAFKPEIQISASMIGSANVDTRSNRSVISAKKLVDTAAEPGRKRTTTRQWHVADTTRRDTIESRIKSEIHS